MRTVFDEAYYRRYYIEPGTRVADEQTVAAQAGLIRAYLRYMSLRVRRILDLGCGLGLLRAPLLEAFPRASYTGVEVSEHLCEVHGWTQGSVVDYFARIPYDLVVCHEVLQYLDDEAAGAALENLARLTRGVLYFGVLTREDWEENVEQHLTDGECYLRKGAWYRRRLRRHFTNAGAGFFVSREASVVLYDLEKLE